MNIIYINQAVKAKTNKREIEKALKIGLEKVFGTTKDNIETAVINTNSIEGIEAGASILVASTKDLQKYAIISLGASTKDIWCVTDRVHDVHCSFEYIMTVDKSVFNGAHVSDTLKEAETNSTLAEAIKMMGIIANVARYDTFISGRYGQAQGGSDKVFSGLAVTDYVNEGGNEINLNVVGRKGRLHLMRIVPLLSEEYNIVKYFDDTTMTELVAIGMVGDGLGDFKDRAAVFNFSKVVTADTLTDSEIEQLKLSRDANGKVVINTLKEVEDFMELKY